MKCLVFVTIYLINDLLATSFMSCGHFEAMRWRFLVINGAWRQNRGSSRNIIGSWVRVKGLRVLMPTISCFPFSMLGVMSWGCSRRKMSDWMFFNNSLMMACLLFVNSLIILLMSCYSMGWGNDLRRGGCSCNRGQSTSMSTVVACKLPRCLVKDRLPHESVL